MFTERYDLLDLDLVLPEDVRDTRSAAPPSSNGRRLTPGHRHRYLLSKAGTLHRAGLTRDAILACLLEENRHRCDPPKADADIRALVDDLTTRYAPDPYTAHVDRVAAEQTEAPPPILSPLDDAVLVAAEGRDIATRGVQYLVPDLVPDYGVLGMSVAFSKVGKTTLAQSLAAAVATGAVFLDRQTRRRRVLVLAVEDPPEYTAYLARRFCVPEGTVTFHRQPLQLDPAGLARIIATVQHGAYGLVLAASWQAMVSGLVRDENDNAGAVTVVERVKAATRQCGIPWLIDAHAGKGEDQSDDADPTRALRGASAAAGAADFMLSLRYARGPFSTERRLSGKGRFVQLAPIVIDYQPESGLYVVLGDSKSAMRETTWAILTETGALTHEWQTAGTIAAHAGLVASTSDASHTVRRHVAAALTRRPGVDVQTVAWRDRTVTQYRRAAGEPA